VPTSAAPSPAKQIAGFIAKFDPAVARLTRAARAALRKRYPAAVEIVYDNYNALAIGFASTERTSDVFVSLAVYASGVNLYFMYGAHLPDPRGTLEGNGNQGRFVRLRSVADLDAASVRALLRAAVAHGDTPLPKTGRGRTIVRSVSEKQRPRRPTGAAAKRAK
jgi:hypothetical protein